MADATVLIDRRDGYTLITLNRPDRLNALSDGLMAELNAAFAAVRDDAACRAVVLTGAGRGFSAGADLAGDGIAPNGAMPDLGAALESRYNPLIRLIRSLDKPVICAVNGVAAGAGANIALACDMVLAARSAVFIQAFTRIALVPDAGGTFWLTRQLGEARAKALALTADPLPAATAADWGLIWKCVDDEALMGEAEALARRFAAGPTRAYAMTKQAINAATVNTLDQQLDLERDLQTEAGRTADFAEGVAAFIAKRPAVFKGR